jgi:hypothetical protein
MIILYDGFGFLILLLLLLLCSCDRPTHTGC